MTFKEYLKTPAGRKAAVKLYRKLKAKKNITDHPISKDSRYMDSSNMGTTSNLAAATQGNQPGMS